LLHNNRLPGAYCSQTLCSITTAYQVRIAAVALGDAVGGAGISCVARVQIIRKEAKKIYFHK
jgi:hypothetical protein